ncbi:MAG TPA: PTS system mannose/fructose/sorbose family transporter subunit IID [Candidatus Saccharimonadaceae bacterium]|nr:PTS system mannose/fructose/sorbose family transporter subunit IID [Candidatus Saccharimonadaceae bacterium]
MARLRWRDRVLMALRAELLQATWNYERQQGLGWAWSLAPALRRLLPDREARCARLVEHTAYFNTQPTLASLALGAAARLEEERVAGGGADAESVLRVRSMLGASLAALGDRLFWLTLRPFAACLGVWVALNGGWRGAVVMLLCYNGVHQVMRFSGIGLGYRLGPAVLDDALRRRLDRLTRALCMGGAIIVGVLVAALLVPGGEPRPLVFQVTLTAGLGLGFVAAQRPRPSPTQWALGAGVLCLAATWWR